MKVKKIAAKAMAASKLAKIYVKAQKEEINYRLLAGSKKIFDPYTSNVYDDLMQDKIEYARLQQKAAVAASAIIDGMIDQLM